MELSLGTAQEMLRTLVSAAKGRGQRLSAVVVDQQGYEIASVRMDGASWFTAGIACCKARSSAAFGRPSAGLAAMRERYPEVVRLAGEQLPFSVTDLPGGLPLFAGERLLGAVGVSGATPEEDVRAAGEAVAAFAERTEEEADE
ncbi:heme-binding protein [Streptomyces sp. NPDC052042]|uniref:heme-binding protein n=1 Tax=Streptomyces sp. NPDC052042 TaxID=3365683 RepID=UPI0037D76237